MSNNDTQNGSTVHPMVLAAAKAMCKQTATALGMDEDSELISWKTGSNYYIADAKEILTACGALECLEALEGLHDMAINDSIRASDLAKSAEALAKVYGSKL